MEGAGGRRQWDSTFDPGNERRKWEIGVDTRKTFRKRGTSWRRQRLNHWPFFLALLSLSHPFLFSLLLLLLCPFLSSPLFPSLPFPSLFSFSFSFASPSSPCSLCSCLLSDRQTRATLFSVSLLLSSPSLSFPSLSFPFLSFLSLLFFCLWSCCPPLPFLSDCLSH